jgi:hypothetical protein
MAKFKVSVEDRLDVRDLIDRYCLAVTRRDWPAITACFAEDATWQNLRDPEVVLKGREFVGNGIRSQIQNMKCLVMMVHSSVIELDGAKGHAYNVLHEVGRTLDDKSDIVMYGIYDDELVKQDGNWLFANRVFRPVHWFLPPGFKI